MTSSEIGLLLPLAVGLIASPVPIAELVVVLLARGRVLNSLLFIAFQTLFLIMGLVIGASCSKALSELPQMPTSTKSLIGIVLGTGLIIIGIIYALKPRTANPDQSSTADSKKLRHRTVILLALTATIANPVNLPLILTAGHIISTDSANSLISGAAFTITAVSPFAIIVLIGISGGKKSSQLLDRIRIWLTKHAPMINVFLCEAAGILLILIAVK